MSNNSGDFINCNDFLARMAQRPHTRSSVWHWSDILRELEAIAPTDATEENNPALSLVNPSVGDGLSMVPSLNGMVQILGPGFHGKGHRHSNYAIFIVKEGHGYSEVEGSTIEWGVGDVFVVPAWARHLHCNGSDTSRAVLYTFQNVPEVANSDTWFFMGKSEGKLVHN